MRHRFHAICPYFAMFPESFAERWVERYTKPGQVVLDPFCGRGTAPFQALLMGRRAIGCDINPVAYCVTRAKTNAPDISSIRRRLTQLQSNYDARSWTGQRRQLPEFFHHAFHKSTLSQLIYLRQSLKWKKSDVDCMIAALVLGSLHGEIRPKPTYLSNQMPRTISTKPDYSIRFWQKHNLTAPNVDSFSLLREKVTFRYESHVPRRRAKVFHQDMRDLPRNDEILRSKIRCVITSPPYLNVTNFAEDQWLRGWFLGGAERPTKSYESRDDRYVGAGEYWNMISDMWRMLGLLLEHGAHVVIRMGGYKLKSEHIVECLEGASLAAQRNVKVTMYEVSEIVRRQTDAFRPGTSGCREEVDVVFHVS